MASDDGSLRRGRSAGLHPLGGPTERARHFPVLEKSDTVSNQVSTEASAVSSANNAPASPGVSAVSAANNAPGLAVGTDISVSSANINSAPAPPGPTVSALASAVSSTNGAPILDGVARATLSRAVTTVTESLSKVGITSSTEFRSTSTNIQVGVGAKAKQGLTSADYPLFGASAGAVTTKSNGLTQVTSTTTLSYVNTPSVSFDYGLPRTDYSDLGDHFHSTRERINSIPEVLHPAYDTHVGNTPYLDDKMYARKSLPSSDRKYNKSAAYIPSSSADNHPMQGALDYLRNVSAFGGGVPPTRQVIQAAPVQQQAHTYPSLPLSEATQASAGGGNMISTPPNAVYPGYGVNLHGPGVQQPVYTGAPIQTPPAPGYYPPAPITPGYYPPSWTAPAPHPIYYPGWGQGPYQAPAPLGYQPPWYPPQQSWTAPVATTIPPQGYGNRGNPSASVVAPVAPQQEDRGPNQSYTGSQSNHAFRSSDGTSKFNPSVWRLRFDGSNVDLGNYLAQFEIVAARQGWNDTDMGSVLIGSIEGKATKVMSQLPRGSISYSVIAAKLKQMFAPEANVHAYRSQFQCRTRKPQESSSDFSLALQDLSGKGYPEMDYGSLQQLQVDQFIKGQPQYIRFALASGMHQTLEAAVAAAIRLETYAQEPRSPAPPHQNGRRHTPVSARANSGYSQYPEWPGWEREPDPPVYEDDSSAQEGEPALDGVQLELIDWISQSAGIEFPGLAMAHATSTPRGVPRCYYCGKLGHIVMRCRKLVSMLRARGFKDDELPKAPVSSGNWKSPGKESSDKPAAKQGN